MSSHKLSNDSDKEIDLHNIVSSFPEVADRSMNLKYKYCDEVRSLNDNMKEIMSTKYKKVINENFLVEDSISQGSKLDLFSKTGRRKSSLHKLRRSSLEGLISTNQLVKEISTIDRNETLTMRSNIDLLSRRKRPESCLSTCKVHHSPLKLNKIADLHRGNNAYTQIIEIVKDCANKKTELPSSRGFNNENESKSIKDKEGSQRIRNMNLKEGVSVKVKKEKNIFRKKIINKRKTENEQSSSKPSTILDRTYLDKNTSNVTFQRQPSNFLIPNLPKTNYKISEMKPLNLSHLDAKNIFTHKVNTTTNLIIPKTKKNVQSYNTLENPLSLKRTLNRQIAIEEENGDCEAEHKLDINNFINSERRIHRVNYLGKTPIEENKGKSKNETQSKLLSQEKSGDSLGLINPQSTEYLGLVNDDYRLEDKSKEERSSNNRECKSFTQSNQSKSVTCKSKNPSSIGSSSLYTWKFGATRREDLSHKKETLAGGLLKKELQRKETKDSDPKKNGYLINKNKEKFTSSKIPQLNQKEAKLQSKMRSSKLEYPVPKKRTTSNNFLEYTKEVGLLKYSKKNVTKFVRESSSNTANLNKLPNNKVLAQLGVVSNENHNQSICKDTNSKESEAESGIDYKKLKYQRLDVKNDTLKIDNIEKKPFTLSMASPINFTNNNLSSKRAHFSSVNRVYDPKEEIDSKRSKKKSFFINSSRVSNVFKIDYNAYYKKANSIEPEEVKKEERLDIKLEESDFIKENIEKYRSSHDCNILDQTLSYINNSNNFKGFRRTSSENKRKPTRLISFKRRIALANAAAASRFNLSNTKLRSSSGSTSKIFHQNINIASEREEPSKARKSKRSRKVSTESQRKEANRKSLSSSKELFSSFLEKLKPVYGEIICRDSNKYVRRKNPNKEKIKRYKRIFTSKLQKDSFKAILSTLKEKKIVKRIYSREVLHKISEPFWRKVHGKYREKVMFKKKKKNDHKTKEVTNRKGEVDREVLQKKLGDLIDRCVAQNKQGKRLLLKNKSVIANSLRKQANLKEVYLKHHDLDMENKIKGDAMEIKEGMGHFMYNDSQGYYSENAKYLDNFMTANGFNRKFQNFEIE